MSKRVVLAMSGGVDSSVAALLLKRQGYEVIGLFMRTGVHAEDEVCTGDTLVAHEPVEQVAANKKGCCSSLDAHDARRVADRLDIPFYALDFEQDFERIIDYFVDEYAAGRTPNPCVMCNNWLKFGKLWSYGKQLGADNIATGHYARIVASSDGPELHSGADPSKDQAYVLFGVRRAILDRLLFPVGQFQKDSIRRMAEEADLPVFNKPDSQEICFVPGGDYAAVVRKHRPNLATAGQIVDRTGQFLTEHDGYEQFTIGQRKGLGYAAGERRYVLEIIPETNQVVVGTKEDCLAEVLTARDVNWLCNPGGSRSGVPPVVQPFRCGVKIRYRSSPAPAVVTPLPDRRARVEFDSPQLAITPGQAAVFYDDTRVLGGGWIERAG